MIKHLLCASLMLLSQMACSQSANYHRDMTALIDYQEFGTGKEDLEKTTLGFEAIAIKEKNQWLPYYYAAKGFMNQSNPKTNLAEVLPLVNKADALLKIADSLQPNNSEITLLKAMNTQCRMRLDWSQDEKLGAQIFRYIDMASRQQPQNNPRIMLFNAQTMYLSQPPFGSRQQGMQLLEQAIAAFKAFKPETDLHPHWGLAASQLLLEQWRLQH